MNGHHTKKRLLNIQKNVKPQSLPVWQALIVVMLSVYIVLAIPSMLIAEASGSGIANTNATQPTASNSESTSNGKSSSKDIVILKDDKDYKAIISYLNGDRNEEANKPIMKKLKSEMEFYKDFRIISLGNNNWYIFDNSKIYHAEIKVKDDKVKDNLVISLDSWIDTMDKFTKKIDDMDSSLSVKIISTLRKYRLVVIFTPALLLIIGFIVGFILSPKIPKKPIYRALRINRDPNVFKLTTRTFEDAESSFRELSGELNKPKNVGTLPTIKMNGGVINNKISNIKKYIQNIESLISETKQKTDIMTKLDQQKLTNLKKFYNSAVDDTADNRFNQKYLPTNVSNVYKTKKLNSDFGSDETFTESIASGDYIMLNIDGNYVVMPKLNYTLDSRSHDSIKKAFDFKGFDPNFIYRNIKLIKPAIFKPGDRESWKVKERGELDLGRGVISTTPERLLERRDTRQPKKPPQTPIEKLRELYNSTIDNPNSSDFYKEYNNVKRFGVENAMARKSDMSISPVFKETSDGEYLLIAIAGGANVVVPKFKLDFNSTIYEVGAMKEVFDCGDFKPELTYRKVKLIEPAFFEPELGGNSWKQTKKGKLDLGQGEG
jgi:hypothetical protein